MTLDILDRETPVIDKIDLPSFDLFQRDYVECGKPVIIRGGLGDGGVRDWTPERLCAVAGKRVFRTAVTTSGWFGYTEHGPVYEYRDYTLEDAIARIRNDPSSKYYVQQVSLKDALPEIMHEAPPSPLIAPGKLQQTNIWISGAGDITPLHFDPFHGFLSQVHGRKVVTLFSPSESDKLYPLSVDSPNSYVWHASQIDLNAPDLDRFPRFAEATRLEAVLEAGEILFLPAFWWHGVATLDFSISLNNWWTPPPQHFFVPILRERLVAIYDRNRLRTLQLDEGGLASVAHRALDVEGLYWCAVIYAAAGFEQYARRRLTEAGLDGEMLPGRLNLIAKALASAVPELASLLVGAEGWPNLLRQARNRCDADLDRSGVHQMVADIRNLIMR